MARTATKRRGFRLEEFVTSCSTCMGKEGLLNTTAQTTTQTIETAPPKQ